MTTIADPATLVAPDGLAIPATPVPAVRSGPIAPGGGLLRPALGASRHSRVKVYVWQLPVRVTHWVTAGAIVLLSVTGLYIADPFLIAPGAPIFTVIRQVHIVTALVFLVSGLVRTWMLLRGNRFARWSAFIPTTRLQATELLRQAFFYAYVRKEIPKVLGHNQLAAAAYVFLFGLLLVETVTGFALDGLLGTEPGATLFAWLRTFVDPQTIRLVHHLAMWLILAIALFHVYSCFLVDNLERSGIVSSIVNGFKYPTRLEVLESRDGGPELLEQAEAAEARDAALHGGDGGDGEEATR